MAKKTRPKAKPEVPTNPDPADQQRTEGQGSGADTAPDTGSYESDPDSIGSLSLTVPGAPRRPPGNLSRSHIAIYGDPKIGKTTFGSDAPGSWFIATERGQDWVEVREPTIVHDWEQWKEFCGFVQTEKPTRFADGTPIETFVIDRIEGLFKMCEEWCRQSLQVESLDELGHGKGWARLSGEFDRVMNKVRRWPFGMITISHARQKEFKTRAVKVDRWEPDIGAAGLRWLLGSADLILYAHSRAISEVDPATGQVTGTITEERVLQCHPSSKVVAGGRMSDRLPMFIPLDYRELRDRIENPEKWKAKE